MGEGLHANFIPSFLKNAKTLKIFSFHNTVETRADIFF